MTKIRFGVITSSDSDQALRQVLNQTETATIIVECHPEADWHRLLQANNLDAVIISASAKYMPRMIIQALENGVHVLASTPAGCSVEDMINIRRAEANARGTHLKFAFDHHHHQSVVAAKQIFDSQELGQLVSMRGVYGKAQQAEGEQLMLNQGMCMLDLMHMFSGPFETVEAIIGDTQSPRNGFEDNVMALLRTNAGVMASLHISSTQWRQTFRLELGFEKGSLWLDGLLSGDMDYAPEMLIVSRVSTALNGLPLTSPNEDIREFNSNVSAETGFNEFIDAMNGKPIAFGTSQQAFDAMNIVQRIYAADQSFIPANIA